MGSISVKLGMMICYHENGHPPMKISQGKCQMRKVKKKGIKWTTTASHFLSICVPMHPTCIQYVTIILFSLTFFLPMEEPLLHQTTITTTSPSSPTTQSIINRLLFLVLIALISIWANYEASKGFEVIILNNAGDTPQGRRFDLLFVSDDRATRIVLNTSKFVERILYPDHHHPRKPVRRITLQLTGDNSTDIIHVAPIGRYPHHEFDIGINPIVMDEADVDRMMVEAVQRAMARVWLWEGKGGAPPELVGGMVECIAMMAGYGPLPGSGGGVPPGFGGTCGVDGGGDIVGVAWFLKYCEGVRRGFLARLNRAMEGAWHVRMVDEALGSPSKRICDSYLSSAIGIVNSTDAASASRELSQEV